MKKSFLIIVIGLMVISSSLWGQTTNVTISAQSQWENTGVTITEEMTVTIEATGEWCGAPWSCYGPEGTGGIAPSSFLAPGLSAGGLVGKVGNNVPFFVGSSCSFEGQDHGTGTLYLAFNDNLSGYGDNSGTLDVTITTTEEGGEEGVELVGQYTGKPAYDLKVRGDYAYVTGLNTKELYILNISDPTNPSLVGTYTSTSNEVREVSLIGDYAYITCTWAGFEVIDISDPSAPTKVGPTHTGSGVAVDFVFANGYGFLANRESGIRVYDVYDPANPVYVTTYSTSTYNAWASSITVNGNYLYIGIEHSPNGFEVFDISNPAVQNKVGTISGTNSVFGIASDDDYVYHSGQWEHTFNIVDVSNPSNPVRLGTGFPTHGDAWGIAVSGNLAFLGERSYGLQVLDISDKTNPALLDEYATGGDPHWGIAVVGDYVYLADGPGGLVVLRYSGQQPPVGPSLLSSIPADGESITNPSTYLYLEFDKPMDMESILQGMTISENGIPLSEDFHSALGVDLVSYEGKDYYRIGGKWFGDLTPVSYNYGTVSVLLDALIVKDQYGSHLTLETIFEFYVVEEQEHYLTEIEYTGGPSGGHYLEWCKPYSYCLGPKVQENTRYTLGVKGDLDIQPSDVVTLTVEIAANGEWLQTIDPEQHSSPMPDINEGRPQYYTGLNGLISIAVRDDAASLVTSGIKWKFTVIDPTDANEENTLELEMYPSTTESCLRYFLKADPNYHTLYNHTLLSLVPFGSFLYDMAAGAEGFDETHLCSLALATMGQEYPFADRDPNLLDYYDIPLFFDSIRVGEGQARSYKVLKTIIEIPIQFEYSTSMYIATVFKPFVASMVNANGHMFPLPQSGVYNKYPTLPANIEGISKNGQFEAGYSTYVNVGVEPPADPSPPISDNIDPELNSLYIDNLYYGLKSKLTDCLFGTELGAGPSHPIHIALFAPEYDELNTVMHYKIVIEPLEGNLFLDKHAGYLYLNIPDNEMSIGHISGPGYGNQESIICRVYFDDGSESLPIKGGMPRVRENTLTPILRSFVYGALAHRYNPISILTTLLDYTDIQNTKKGMRYAAPLLIPNPKNDENSFDIYEVDLFCEPDSRKIVRIEVDIPLICHKFPSKFDLLYLGRPWKEGVSVFGHEYCYSYDLTGEASLACEEHHCYKHFDVGVGPSAPSFVIRGLCPVSLRITDPDGNVISPNENSIPGATYTEFDGDLDGTNESEVVFEQPANGEYLIEAMPNIDANPDDEYSILATWAGQGTVIADHVRIQDMPSSPYVFNVSIQPRIFGTVSEAGGLGLVGVTVDIIDSSGSLVASIPTNTYGSYECTSLSSGLYTVSVVPPLGYAPTFNNVETRLLVGSVKEFNFYLQLKELANEARGVGYWKHQVNVHLSGKGNAQESLEQMSGYMNAIATHFNANLANPVNIFEVLQPATQNDSLEALQTLLAEKGKAGMNEKAKKHVTALLLNVASLKLHQTTVISEDSATASQSITYCYQLITDSDPANDETAKDIAEIINEGQAVPAGWIDPLTPDVAYKQNDTEQLPTEFSLSQNFPNPFNPVTEISFALPNASDVKLEIFNIMGQRVAVLAEGPLEAGYHSVIWDGNRVASGVYFYRLDAGDFVETKKMVLLK